MTLVLEWRAVAAVETGWVAQAEGAVLPAAIIGPPGRDGTQPYEHVQASAAASWTVNHNLGRWPIAVTVVTTGGVEVTGDVTHVSTNQTAIAFAQPFAGRARVI
jgi:hypothetical protein